jgi:hypothetical protein
MDVSRETGVPHRRVYDFFNLLGALGVCEVIHRGRIAWVGLTQMKIFLRNAYAQLEVASLTHGLEELFRVGPSPTLGLLATRFFCMFLYLGVDILSIKHVAVVFCGHQSDFRSIERRLYLVLAFLDVLGVISRTGKTSEYALATDCTEIIEYAMEKRRSNSAKGHGSSLEALMNRKGPSQCKDLYRQRLSRFTAIAGVNGPNHNE